MTRPLRIAYFLKCYPRLSETFILNEMLELQRQGIEMIIVAKKDEGEQIIHEKVQDLKAPIYYLPPSSSQSLKDWKVRHIETFATKPNWLGLEALRQELSKEDYITWIQAAMMAPFLKGLGIDHIHAHFATWAATAASFVSQITGIPYSFTAHAKDIYHEGVNKKALAERIEKARFVITVSDFNKRVLQALIRTEGRSGRIIRLYNGIDLDQFKPDDEEQEPGLIVGVGRLIQKKGFEYLIEACQILKERGRHFHCAIIGEGEKREALERLIEQFSLGKEVSLLGARTQDEVLRIIRRATVFVLPCVIGEDGNRDALPTALLESMALGVPVISTRITGIPEIVTHGRTGLLVQEKDPKALAQAIETMLGSEPLRQRLSRLGRLKVRKHFNLTENVKILKEYFLSRGIRTKDR